MGRKKKGNWRIPKILWTIYKDKARSLATTITSLIPRLPPPSLKPFSVACRCHGRSCLQCCEDPMSFLLRPDDPLHYKKLLNNCFVVVDDNAPFLEYYPDRHWSQKQIVQKVVEMMLAQRPKSSNLLCAGYNRANGSYFFFCLDGLLEGNGGGKVGQSMNLNLLPSHLFKLKRLSMNVEVLTSQAWDIFLERVGDGCMVYLLRHTSIFLPLSDKKHLQVAGSPINNLCKKLSKNEIKPQSGIVKKRKLTENSNSVSKRQQYIPPPVCDISSNSVDCANSQTGEAVAKSDEGSSGELKICSSPTAAKHKKFRLFHWKRNKKRRLLNTPENREETILQTVSSDANCLPGGLKCPVNTNQMPVHCSCYLMLKAPHSKCLMENIFGLSDANACWQQNLSTMLEIVPFIYTNGSLDLAYEHCRKGYHSFLKLLKKLIRRSRRFKPSKLLEKYCPLPSLDQKVMGNSISVAESNVRVLEQFYGVGAKGNNNILEADNKKLESNGSYCLHSQVPKNGTGQKSGEASWSLRGVKHKLLVNWIFWFFSSFVVPLVQANFYVTESEHGKLDVFYYRKPVWEKLTDHSITGLKDQSYLELDEAAVRAIIDKRQFGFSRLRLCPKQNGVRKLANLKASSRLPGRFSSKHKCPWMQKSSRACSRKKYNRFKSVNSVLRGTHAVLKGILLKEPEKYGSSVFDYNDVYRKLSVFLITLKSGLKTMPSVFVVVADVSKAFDSIYQDKLLGIMEDVVTKDEYSLDQINQVVCSNKCLWDRENLTLVDETVNTGFANLMSSVPFRSLPGVFVNQGSSRIILREELFSNLYEHVKRNVLLLDKKFYLQGMGIPQGSVLSTLLCSLYYGHMEKHVISPYLEKTTEDAAKDIDRLRILSDSSVDEHSSHAFVFPPTYLLVRFIDDFLFISTSKEQASGFLSMMLQGFPDYNCYMNEEKFCFNFDIECQSGLLSNRVYVVDNRTSFLRWSGLLINCNTLEIQGDYTRYLANHLSSTLTIHWQGKPGNRLRWKLYNFMKPRCHPLFFDSNINSASVVRLNVYQAFLLCAMKFHCHVSEMSYIFKPRRRYCLKMIEKSLRYMYRLIKKRMCSTRIGPGKFPVLKLMKEEVVWLGYHAYIEVLKRKQSRHSGLLSLLRSKYFNHKLTGIVSSELRYAVERSHSSSLWKIKY
ncbi:reverse transcriptase [Corchorus olitorius]|uniref:Telomerase reverse transcriptase n=1 Tax=Corchorus olitorius TaxID=93759 RepID=A0A1R3KT84_9ROSI|nr:reverse transcriptase [Corchorus olitorius]